jgi:hypothetical protein
VVEIDAVRRSGGPFDAGGGRGPGADVERSAGEGRSEKDASAVAGDAGETDVPAVVRSSLTERRGRSDESDPQEMAPVRRTKSSRTRAAIARAGGVLPRRDGRVGVTTRSVLMQPGDHGEDADAVP